MFWVIYKKISADKIKEKDISIVVFDEVKIDDGLLKKSVKVRIKQQFYYKGIPIGEATTVSENTFEIIDKERVESLLKDYAKPLLDIGIAIVEFKSGGLLGKLKK